MADDREDSLRRHAAPGAGGAARWAPLAAICVVALLVRIWSAIALPNVVWPDEIFQTLEQGHRLAFGYGIVPWEFRDGARSWLLPGTLGGAMAAAGWLGGLAHVRAAQLLLAALSLVPVCAAYLWALPRGRASAATAAVACAAWFELVLFAPKALGEVVGAHALAAALLLASGVRARRALAWAGAAFALAVALRIQLAPGVAVAAAMAGGRDLRRWRSLALGAAPVLLLAGALDWATWGAPFHSYVETLRVNVLAGRSRMYGVAPWWAYGAMLREAWSWALPAVLGLAALGARRVPAAAAAAVAIVAAHSLIEHKEYRFLYPAVELAIVLAALGLAEAAAWVSRRARIAPAVAAVIAAVAWAGASGALAARSPAWSRGEGLLEATRRPAELGACGVALVGLSWASTGGYTWLHRDVPIYLVDDAPALVAAWDGFDAALVSPEYVPMLRGFAVDRCWPLVCVLRRSGGCTRVAAPTVNEQLTMRGE